MRCTLTAHIRSFRRSGRGSRMNARIRPPKRVMDAIRAETRKEAVNALEAEEQKIIARVMAYVCMALHEQYGFGQKRLSRVIYQAGQEAVSLDVWKGIEDIEAARFMRRLGMDVLADTLDAPDKNEQEGNP